MNKCKKPKKEIEIMLNGKRLTSFKDPKDLVGIIAKTYAYRIPYLSGEALTNYLIQMKEILEEIADKFGVNCSRTINFIERTIDKKLDRNKLEEFFYNLILGYHKESTLKGFGYIAMEKTEDGARRKLKDFRINPEKTSLTQFSRIND
jgi:hypothetical protein